MMGVNSVRDCFVAALLAMTSMFASTAWASNLQLSGLDEVSANTAGGTMTFSFNLSQDNSWRNQTNYDAVWVFMKYSTDGGATWKHASMAGSGINPAGFSIPAQFASQFEVFVPSDQKGFFVQRSAQASGNIALTGIQFTWNYALDGLSAAVAQSGNTLTTIYGIEMVYIPQGAFYAGDGSSNSSTEYAFTQGSAVTEPWYIQNENAIQTTGAASGTYYYQNTGAKGDEFASGSSFLIPASFPKGYGAFYLMKYELTEGEWVAFFNTLPVAARPYRDITSANTRTGGKNSEGVVNRNTISWNAAIPSSPATTLRPARPVSYISWPDLAAYAEWAALRPITELEYEKAARGKDDPPTPGEFVWGTTSYTAPGAGDIVPNGDENGAETLKDTANINSNSVAWTSGDGRSGGIAAGQMGPLRVGIFAASVGTSTNPRASAGAGYYGNMELSGNLAEPVVTVGRPEGLNFQGTDGTGVLTTYGFATNADWPGMDSNTANGVDGTVGIGYRGGDFQSPNSSVYATSSRFYAAKDPDSQGCMERYDPSCGVFYGGRLGRNAT
ncbi:MAG: SUMF1/EgtB/PvdO family nonheme iron enzyme [Candidatus Omnitrophica bacterium]|nr:SUMF1/EgtB/PvdO family nonheme iron enzyme [Candidatus Omnitrophota bacterium]